MKIVGGAILVLAGAVLLGVGMYTDATLEAFSQALAREQRRSVGIMTVAGVVVGVLGFAVLIWGLVDDLADRRRLFRNSRVNSVTDPSIP